jgi:hypothetical protein
MKDWLDLVLYRSRGDHNMSDDRSRPHVRPGRTDPSITHGHTHGLDNDKPVSGLPVWPPTPLRIDPAGRARRARQQLTDTPYNVSRPS